jgi:hypothetical protein
VDGVETGPRSVKIDQNERGAWTSDRPRREGEPERPPRKQDISVRCRVLTPSDRTRYSPGSLLLVVGHDAGAVESLVERRVEEQGTVLSIPRLAALVRGKVPADEEESKAAELREAVAAKKLAKGETVVVTLPSLDEADREHWARAAAAHRRPRHLLFVDTKSEDPEVAAQANVLRKKLTDGALGAEGFFTAMRVSGAAVDERSRIVFAPPPKDD